jgi:hypothetical protein
MPELAIGGGETTTTTTTTTTNKQTNKKRCGVTMLTRYENKYSNQAAFLTTLVASHWYFICYASII